MPLTDPFEQYTDRYDEWFDRHPEAFESEVAALQALRPEGATGLEIGVGTGRFAERLGIDVGIDPARSVLPVAAGRGVSVVRGVAESLPVRDDSFGLALVVTTICFVDDVSATLAEAARVIRPGGSVLLGYIDRESEVGKHYQDIQDENPFYRDATFLGTAELIETLRAAGFRSPEARQTVFAMPDELAEPDPVREGYGDGSFVALRATLPA